MDHRASGDTPLPVGDVAFGEPPRLRRLGTLADLTRGQGLGNDDMVGGGYQGEGGDSFPNA